MKSTEVENDFLNIFEWLDNHQGKSLSLRDALILNGVQDSLISKSLAVGIKRIKAFSHAKTSKLDSFYLFLQYYKIIDSGKILHGNFSLKEESDKMYRSIHSSTLSNEEKIFLEFAVGISRLTLAIQIISKFVMYLSDTNQLSIQNSIQMIDGLFCENHENNFFERASIVSDIGVSLVSIIAEHYTSGGIEPSRYWIDVEYFFTKFTHLGDLAQILVSIQHVPKNNIFMSVMQTLHWRGLGGSGEILKQYPELQNIIRHAINHHSGYEINTPFDKRMSVFKAPLDAILDETQRIIISFFNKQFPHEVLNVYDFCSGPRYVAVRKIFEQMTERKFNLTVSDVDGGSLAAVIKENEENTVLSNVHVKHVCYEDLLLITDNSPDIDTKYHLVSVNLGLHQLPIDKIYTALRYFSKIIKLGGLISNLDASKKRVGQLMIIPGNLVDREGYVLDTEHIDLTKLTIAYEDTLEITLPYPMIRLTQKIIKKLEKSVGVGPYIASFYIVVKIKPQDFNRLNALWNLKMYDDCDEIISKYTPNFNSLQTALLEENNV